MFADLQAELRALSADVREMLRLRMELARLEIEGDIDRTKRLAAILVAAAIMVLTSLPLLIGYLAEILDGWQGIARRQWLLIFGLVLFGPGILSAIGGWRWFRRRFVGLKETLEELREDAQWAKELR